MLSYDFLCFSYDLLWEAEAEATDLGREVEATDLRNMNFVRSLGDEWLEKAFVFGN